MSIQMTRAEYEAKYGRKPNVPPKVVATQETVEEPGFLGRVKQDISKRGENVYEAISGTGQYQGQSPVRRGFEATNQAFKGITDTLGEAIKPAIDVVKGGIDKVNEFGENIGIKPIEKVTSEGYSSLIESLNNNPQYQQLILENPDTVKKIEEILGTISSAGGIAGTILTTNAATQATQAAVNKGLDVGSKVVSKTGEVVKNIGKKLNASAYNPTADEARLIQNNQIKVKFLENELSKTSPGSSEYDSLSSELARAKANAPVVRSDTALAKGIAGTEKQIGVDAGVEKMSLWKNKIEPALRGSKVQITKDELLAKARERVASEIEPTRQANFKRALEALEDDYKNIDSYNLIDANKVKSSLDKFTPAKIFKGQDVASELKILKADVADAIRSKTYNAITDTNIKADYRDYANLKQLENVGIKAITEGGKRGGYGNFWSTIKDELTVPIKTIGGKVLYKTGSGLEFIGEKGLRSVKDYINAPIFSADPIKNKAINLKLKDAENGFNKGGTTSNTIDMHDKLIKSGDMDVSRVYKDPTAKIYQPEVAKQIVSDGVNNLKSFGFNDLANKYEQSFGDFTKVTPRQILINGKNVITNEKILSLTKESAIGGTGLLTEVDINNQNNE